MEDTGRWCPRKDTGDCASRSANFKKNVNIYYFKRLPSASSYDIIHRWMGQGFNSPNIHTRRQTRKANVMIVKYATISKKEMI